MQTSIKWVCEHLLFDPFEFAFWLTVMSQDEFDILLLRQRPQLADLQFEYLMLYVGLHVKLSLNDPAAAQNNYIR